MTSGRPYRGAQMSFDEAIVEVRRCSGTQFDPDVVGAFIQAVDGGAIPIPALSRVVEA
jgi:HD-GYP domain-containing protein (c-di-GMP phosphodiesterase class II)